MIKEKNFLNLFFSILLSLFLTISSSLAQSSTVKYVYTLDYPMGEKAEYLDWISSIASTLQEPAELLSIASYDNYFNASPQRYIEFVFANTADATKYFENPEISRIVDELVNHGINVDIHLIKGRGDYNIENEQRRAIKYVFNLDYGLRGKDEYINWVKSIVHILQKPEEIRKIESFDNYFNASPNRFIEFEFDSMEDAIKYFDFPEVKEVIEMSTEKSINHSISVLRLRGDYYSNQSSINEQ
jgi:hypothetical protein